MTASTPVPSAAGSGGWLDSNLRFVREYPHPPAKVWRALTEPALMARWGMRPEGYSPTLGTRFTLHGDANPAWRGFVECEVVELQVQRLIAYRWVDNDGATPTLVRNTLEETPTGTRLTLEHQGFTGVGGFLFSKLIMGPGLRKTLGTMLPRVLAELSDSTSPQH